MQGPLEPRPRPPEAVGRKCPAGPRRYRVRVSPLETGGNSGGNTDFLFALSLWLGAFFRGEVRGVTESKRDPGLDVVRSLAICMVILIHISAGFVLAVLPPGGGDWWAALLWSGPARMAVPLFFMCSGALMLSKEVSPRRLLTHNLPRILTAMFFWAFVHRLASLFAAGSLFGAEIWQAAKQTLLFQHEFHFYYLHILLVVYAFLPALAVFVRTATRRELEYLLGVWFVVGILCPILPIFWPFSLVPPIQSWWTLGLSFTCVGYALLGYYLRRFASTIPSGYYIAALLLGAFITVGGCAWFSLKNGVLHEPFLGGNTPGAFLMACGLFGLAVSKKSYPPFVAKPAQRLARASFCIYLTHYLFQRGFARLGLGGVIHPCALSIPAIALLILACSYLLWEVLHRIPICKDYLV